MDLFLFFKAVPAGKVLLAKLHQTEKGIIPAAQCSIFPLIECSYNLKAM